MKEKRVFYTELAYVFGIIVLAVGTALMERANYGMSMVVAPAYLLHLKFVRTFPFFSFGMAEYTLQAALLLVLALVMRRFKLSYLFSFVTAVVYGFALDGAIALVGLVSWNGTVSRIVFFVIGMLCCSCGVSLLFHTYLSPEAYELFVKEVSVKVGMNINKFKTIYDCTSCLVGILLSFAFFGLWHFEGVKLGTIFCALVNGFVIGRFTGFFERMFEFRDGWKLRKLFER